MTTGCMVNLYAGVLTVYNVSFLVNQVSGDANFSMKRTGLTLGGFIQPSVSRYYLEQVQSSNHGLSQRFLWFVPKSKPVLFRELTTVNKEFKTSLGMYLLIIRTAQVS